MSSSCTYTAQGFLLCPKQNTMRSQPHYSTIGFDRDAEAGVFIEPFEQYQQGAPSNTEKFAVQQKNIQLPAWVTDPNEQFSTQCKSCSIDAASCKGGKDNKCNLMCKCSSCINGKITSKPIIQSVPTVGGSKLFYCGGNKYSEKCDDYSALTCSTTQEETSSKSAFVDNQRQHFQNSPYNMAQ